MLKNKTPVQGYSLFFFLKDFLSSPSYPSCRLNDVFPLIADGTRTAVYQGVFQLIGLCVTLGTAVIGGSLVGESHCSH